MLRPVESLSRRQRERTPETFARLLVEAVLRRCRAGRVAALWLCKTSPYYAMPGVVDPWGPERDARLYCGPLPIVAHPPCGPWGKFRWRCKQSPLDGILAMELVHRWGGVVEQPLGSRLFREHGRNGWIQRVNQGDYGHLSPKATLLYWHNGLRMGGKGCANQQQRVD